MDWKQQRDKYIAERVIDQYNWYNQKSGGYKKWYYRCRIIVIASGALIPLLVGYASGAWDWLKYVAGALGAVVAITEGIQSLKKYRENWSAYRATAEMLKREQLLFENNAGDDYAAGDEAAFKRFVLKIEKITAAENNEWNALLASSASPTPPANG